MPVKVKVEKSKISKASSKTVQMRLGIYSKMEDAARGNKQDKNTSANNNENAILINGTKMQLRNNAQPDT